MMIRGKNVKRVSFGIILLLLLVVTACGVGNQPPTSSANQPTGEQVNEAESTTNDVEEEVFKIGIIPALTEGDYEVAMNKLEKVLDEALPAKVELEVFPDYNAVVESLNFGHIQMAYLGPSTYVIANERSGAQAIITQLIDGKPYYHSYIITHVDNPWNTLDEFLENVEERSFAFGDVNSTSGTLVPSVELRERGVYTDENTYLFKELHFTGSHDYTGKAVQNKHVDAGAIDSAFYATLINQGVLDESEIKVIWESDPLFQYPWTVAADVDPDTVKLIQDTFLAIDDEEILKGFGATGFTIATDEDYEAIRKVMRETGKIN